MIPVCLPSIPKNAKEYVSAVIDGNWVSSRCLEPSLDFISKLENAFSSFIGVEFGVAVNSGTAALDLAVTSLGIGPDDEVIVPSFTMIASAASVIRSGARPVFIDADPDTWCISVDIVEGSVSSKTRAIMPVHIYGYPCDMHKINSLAEKHGLFIIEDAAEAIDTQYFGKRAGSMSDFGCFSFYANKTVTCGEGGMLVTSDRELARRAAKLKDQAFGVRRFVHEELGFNFRMSNILAAYAYASFEEVESAVSVKKKNAALYSEALSDIAGLTLPPRSTDDIINTFWMYGVLMDRDEFGISKEEAMRRLREESGIETRDFFLPMHRQPVMINSGFVDTGTAMPVSDMLWERGFYLPSGIDITERDIAYIADSIRSLHKTR